jgi:hypothetical protein
MKPETYQLFAQLCESLVFEVSSSMDVVKSLPGGPQVVKFLHSQKGLGHEQTYVPAGKISWSELKNHYKGSWVLMKYPKGVGAIKQTSGSYEAVASSGGDPVTFQNDRGGNILDFLKGELGGNPKAIYVGKDTGNTKDVKSTRKQRDSELKKVNQLDPDAIMIKFRPLWIKSINTAIADIKGMVATQIKNDAFHKAEKKLNQAKSLQSGLEALEAGSTDVPSFIKGAIQQALALTAGHYYPEQTGEISASRYGGYNNRSEEGVSLILKDISGGDQAKLGTVLAFFKRSLISG